MLHSVKRARNEIKTTTTLIIPLEITKTTRTHTHTLSLEKNRAVIEVRNRNGLIHCDADETIEML